MDNKKIAEAKENLSYYLKIGFEAAGNKWDIDNETDVSGIVDLLVEGVKDEIMQPVIEIKMQLMSEKDKEAFIDGTELAFDYSLGSEVSSFDLKLYEALIQERTNGERGATDSNKSLPDKVFDDYDKER